MSEGSMVERVARAIAEGLGDDFDYAFDSKSEWNAERGERAGRFRDINEPFQGDYLEAARSAIAAMRTPTPTMIAAGDDLDGSTVYDDRASAEAHWEAMIDAALQEAPVPSGG